MEASQATSVVPRDASSAEPDPAESQMARRRELLGNFRLVRSSGEATPKKSLKWKELYKGENKRSFNRALVSVGFELHEVNSNTFVRDRESRYLVQLLDPIEAVQAAIEAEQEAKRKRLLGRFSMVQSPHRATLVGSPAWQKLYGGTPRQL